MLVGTGERRSSFIWYKKTQRAAAWAPVLIEEAFGALRGRRRSAGALAADLLLVAF